MARTIGDLINEAQSTPERSVDVLVALEARVREQIKLAQEREPFDPVAKAFLEVIRNGIPNGE